MIKKMLLTYALDSDGNLVNIDSVKNGLACGCVCPGCKESLVAKNGGCKKEHHFAHKSNKDCPSGNETAIHLLAKEIIREQGVVPGVFNAQWQFVKAQSIEIEKDLGDIKPDLYATVGGEPLAIEILVTHAVDRIKYDKIQRLSLRTIEINLSNVEKIDKELIKNAIYDVRSLRLIYDPAMVKGYLEQKKQFLKNHGVKKLIKGDIVQQCPLACEVDNWRRTVRLRNVRCNLCRSCFVSFVDGDTVYCGGYMKGRTQAWFMQSNINEDRYMHVEEASEKVESFKNKIRQYML